MAKAAEASLLPIKADNGAIAAPSEDRAQQSATLRIARTLACIVLLGLCVTAALWTPVVPSAAFRKHRPFAYTCPQVEPVSASNASRAVTLPEYRALAVSRLSEAVRHPTISWDDFGPPGQDPRWAPFEGFHAFLERSFPLLYQTATVESVSTYSLLFRLDGTTTLKPTMLTGHQDVVPVEDPEAWTHPPFAGVVDDEGWIWGRGTTDTKAVTIGILLAVERLLESGWRPSRPVVLALGQDEEVRGNFGSKHLAVRLDELFGPGGVATILDVGAASMTSYGRDFSLVSVAEKGASAQENAGPGTHGITGYADLSIEVRAPASHSSMPASENAISLLARLASAYHAASPLRPRSDASSPIIQQAICTARHGKDVPKRLKRAVDRGDLRALSRHVATGQWGILQLTTKAWTIMRAGSKVNVVPPAAHANFNHRLGLGTTLDQLNASVWSTLGPLARDLGLRSGTNLTVSWDNTEEASALSSIDSPAWRALGIAERTILPGMIMTPFFMPGYTDVRRYAALSHNIYRHAPSRPNLRFGAHGTNERVHADSLIQAIQVYIGAFVRCEARSRSDVAPQSLSLPWTDSRPTRGCSVARLG
jgi:Gly-Xaa carboxypeptidase